MACITFLFSSTVLVYTKVEHTIYAIGLKYGQPKAYLKMFIAALYLMVKQQQQQKTELQFHGVSIIYSSHTLYLGCMNE